MEKSRAVQKDLSKGNKVRSCALFAQMMGNDGRKILNSGPACVDDNQQICRQKKRNRSSNQKKDIDPSQTLDLKNKDIVGLYCVDNIQ
jgi:hypothetical protein